MTAGLTEAWLSPASIVTATAARLRPIGCAAGSAAPGRTNRVRQD